MLERLERFKSKFSRRTASPGRPESQQTTPQAPKSHFIGLKQLFPTDENHSDPPEGQKYPVDIVAVHGLNGDAFSTWTHKPDGTLWLRDLLPKSLPGCRVYTYGYPSQVFSESFAQVPDFARGLLNVVRDRDGALNPGPRPIIFVCHSLGGIVFKKALILAHEEGENYKEVLESIVGVAFLATPHRGSEVAKLANVIGTIINTCMVAATSGTRPKPVRADLLKYLKLHSDELQELNQSAIWRFKKLAVVSFYEQNPTSHLPSLIVDSASATLSIPDEEIVPMFENHKTISRFPGETTSYTMIANAIRKMALRSADISPPADISQPSRRASTHSSFRTLSEKEKSCLNLLHQNSRLDQDDEWSTPPKPTPGTCQWIHSHELFTSFLEEGGNAFLWLTGHPGCGKTMLSFSLCKYFEEHFANVQPLNVLIHSCSNKYSKQTDGRDVLIHLIFQIVNRRRSIISHVLRVLEVQGPSMVKSFNSLWNIFLNIVKDPKAGTLYIILDALDECESKSCKMLISAISEMLTESTTSNTRVKFIVTSRPHLRETLARSKRALQLQISIDDGQVGYVADLERFIHQRVEDISINQQYPSHVREFLLETMLAKADRTFLWINIILASVEESLLTSLSHFRSIIASIPQELAATYTQYLTSISSKHPSQAARMIKLLLASPRPLALDEFNTAFTIKASHNTTKDVELDGQTAVSHTVQGILGPLARVHGSQISLIHQSLKEFLLGNDEDPGSFRATHRMSKEDSALEMASACIQYLRLDDFGNDLFGRNDDLNLEDEWVEDSEGDEPNLNFPLIFREPVVVYPRVCDSLASKYGFYGYASRNWAYHFAICEEVASEKLRDAAMELLDVDKACARNWQRFYCTEATNFWNGDFPDRDRHPIVLAAYFDLQVTLKQLLKSGDTSQEHMDRGLFWASRAGHSRIVDSLLTAGADPNFEKSFQRVLTEASEHGQLEVVRMLLADGRTDINGEGNKGKSALSFACANGHESIVNELLGREDCKVDQLDHHKSQPFYWAVGGGNLRIISKLAGHPRVNINHRDDCGRTALSWASEYGRDDVLRHLLGLEGIDVNLKDNNGRSPLSWAAGTRGRANAVAILLNDPAVDVLSVDEIGRNAISWAAAGGASSYESVVKLLDKGELGADVADEDGRTPLAYAVEFDSPKTVQALLSVGHVDLERTDYLGKTALVRAVDWGHPRIVQALLQAGADPESVRKQGNSALVTAVEHRRDKLLEVLKEYGIEWKPE